MRQQVEAKLVTSRRLGLEQWFIKLALMPSSLLAAEFLLDTLMNWVSKRAESEPQLSETWLKMHQVRTTASELNLTPLQTATKLFTVLQDGVKAVSA